MASINDKIDAAVPLMKARAAQFNETKEMGGPGTTFGQLIDRAERNLWRVHRQLTAPIDAPCAPTPFIARADILDCMNLCALALSLLPEEATE